MCRFFSNALLLVPKIPLSHRFECFVACARDFLYLHKSYNYLMSVMIFFWVYCIHCFFWMFGCKLKSMRWRSSSFCSLFFLSYFFKWQLHSIVFNRSHTPFTRFYFYPFEAGLFLLPFFFCVFHPTFVSSSCIFFCLLISLCLILRKQNV